MSGILLGYRLLKHPDNKRLYYFVDKNGQYKESYNVHSAGVKKLLQQNLVFEKAIPSNDQVNNLVFLTTKGFNLIYDRLAQLTGISNG